MLALIKLILILDYYRVQRCVPRLLMGYYK